jgi:hypothetical protein
MGFLPELLCKTQGAICLVDLIAAVKIDTTISLSPPPFTIQYNKMVALAVFNIRAQSTQRGEGLNTQQVYCTKYSADMTHRSGDQY